MYLSKYGSNSSQLLAAIFLCLIGFGFDLSDSRPVLGQDSPVGGQERRSLKPSVKSYFSTTIDDPRAITKLPLSAELKAMARGRDPVDKGDLLLLQNQLSELAKKLPLVTVNLQHGNTQGSGVIISPDGYILTAAHVAGKPSQRISVTLHDGTRVEGESFGMNRDEDAGLVKITRPSRDESDPWPHASLGRSSDVEKGAWVIAFGHPGGWQSDRPAVVRFGRILKKVKSTIITDCPLIGGDSGGPLFDLEGKVIAIHSRIGVDISENMHVPVEVFYGSHERLVAKQAWGSLPGFKPYIGVQGVREDQSNGRCIIQNVERGGPADRAGLKPGDIVVKFDEQRIGKFRELKEAVDSLVPGDSVLIEVERNSRIETLRVTIGLSSE